MDISLSINVKSHQPLTINVTQPYHIILKKNNREPCFSHRHHVSCQPQNGFIKSFKESMSSPKQCLSAKSEYIWSFEAWNSHQMILNKSIRITFKWDDTLKLSLHSIIKEKWQKRKKRVWEFNGTKESF